MMGHRQVEQTALFYEFWLERHVPGGHLLRFIDRFVDLSALHRELGSGSVNLGWSVIHGIMNAVMEDFLLLSDAQMARISPFSFCRMVFRGSTTAGGSAASLYVIKHGLQWKDAPKGYGPHKTLYNRFIRWSRLGVFDRIFAGLAGKGRSRSAS